MIEKVFELAMNAFIGIIDEMKLEEYGIDRSEYRQRFAEDFKIYLSKMPYLDHGQRMIRAKSCMMYVTHALFPTDDWSRLDELWRQKTVKISEVRNAARRILSEAIGQKITPERYDYLQRFFLQTVS